MGSVRVLSSPSPGRLCLGIAPASWAARVCLIAAIAIIRDHRPSPLAQQAALHAAAKLHDNSTGGGTGTGSCIGSRASESSPETPWLAQFHSNLDSGISIWPSHLVVPNSPQFSPDQLRPLSCAPETKLGFVFFRIAGRPRLSDPTPYYVLHHARLIVPIVVRRQTSRTLRSRLLMDKRLLAAGRAAIRAPDSGLIRDRCLNAL
ncbi:hypothetical protein TrVFT333_000985 [Trichoderma virens FT-333]|nr:hypothetical protein TrVFT333_000985 [Trichoderma virens FT-333]